MGFKVEFETDNDSFAILPEAEVCWILDKVQTRARDGYREGKVQDSNGSNIGSWSWT